MSYAEDLYNRLTSGMANTDQYLAKLSDRGQPSETEMAALRKATMTDPMMQSPRSMQGQPMPSQAEMEALRQMMQGQPATGLAGAVRDMGALGEEGRDYVRSVIGKAPQSPIAQRGMPTETETNTLRQMMTPEDQAAYFKSFENAGINLTPGAGIARGLLNMDQAITNATTAPNVLQQNQLQNIATGQSNVSPYGLGLGQQMYNPEMLRGLLGF